MSRALVFTFPSHFLAFFSQTTQVVDYPRPLDSLEDPLVLMYARFPYASIVGECSPSFLEHRTRHEFSTFIRDPTQYTLYRNTIDYPALQKIIPEYNPVRDRYYILSDQQYEKVQESFLKHRS